MQRIGFVLYPGFQVMAFAVTTVFEITNLALGKPVYDVVLLSEDGGSVPASAGFGVDTKAFGRQSFDTVIFAAGAKIEPMTPRLLAFARRALKTSRRIAAPCSGAFVLAEAGILDGRRATTHWYFARDFQARYPEVKLEEDRMCIIDGPIWTSAGMTGGIDLALAMVEEDHGREVARDVARKLVVYHRRAGGQSQFSALLELDPKTDRIQNALGYAKRNLRNELSVEELAEVARLSPRQFSRVFHAETRQSPAKAVESLRVEAARSMLEDGRHSLDVIANEVGFADRERMRRAFLRVLGQPPQALRRNARAAA